MIHAAKVLYVTLFMLICSLLSQADASPKNIILFIGDGMGFEQMKAGRYYLGEPLSFESFPITMWSLPDRRIIRSRILLLQRLRLPPGRK